MKNVITFELPILILLAVASALSAAEVLPVQQNEVAERRGAGEPRVC